ncbi:MAG: TonB-dependent receptor [Verrucomicrobia bacterium]|nr:TonB-dependent receptor [Verrucomicrobiota bacterium]
MRSILKGMRGLVLASLVLAATITRAQETRPPPNPATNLADLSLEQLMEIPVDTVYSASKHKESRSAAPSLVSIVTAQDIQQYGYRTLGDILNSVRGFYVTGDRNYSFLGVRGFNRPDDYGGRTLLMVDGHRLNEALFDTTSYGHDFILDVDLIDRVEVVRGPGAVLYGNNAFFSVVNVIPKRGRDYHWGEVSVGGGNYDSYQGRFTVGKQFTNGLEILFSGTYFDTKGEKRIHYVSADPANPLPNGGVAENLDYERSRSFFSQLRYGDFTLTGAYASREKATSAAPYLTTGLVFNDPTAQTIDEPSYLDVVNYDWSRSEAVDGEVQVGKTLWDRHVLTAGAEYRELFHNRYQNEDLNPAVIYTSINPRQRTWGVFANAEAQLYRTNLTLHAGVRYDGFSEFDSALSPRAALIVRPWNPTTFKVLYGQAYRTPNVYEAAFNSVPGNAGGASPGPETIRTVELGWEQELGKHFRTTVSAYRNEITDLIDTELLGGAPHLVNRGQVESRGVEFEIEGRAKSRLRGRVSYALQETWDTATDKTLSNSPRHLAKFNLSVPLYQDKVFAGLEVQCESAVRSVYDTRINSFWLMNATLFSQKIVRGLEFTASVQNLFDQPYAFPGSLAHRQAELPQLGRSLWFKLTYRF